MTDLVARNAEVVVAMWCVAMILAVALCGAATQRERRWQETEADRRAILRDLNKQRMEELRQLRASTDAYEFGPLAMTLRRRAAIDAAVAAKRQEGEE